MRIALFADIHANVQALDACIEHARAQGADRLAFLGDFVGYGADAQAVVSGIAARPRECEPRRPDRPGRAVARAGAVRLGGARSLRV